MVLGYSTFGFSWRCIGKENQWHLVSPPATALMSVKLSCATLNFHKLHLRCKALMICTSQQMASVLAKLCFSSQRAP